MRHARRAECVLLAIEGESLPPDISQFSPQRRLIGNRRLGVFDQFVVAEIVAEFRLRQMGKIDLPSDEQ